MKDIKSDSSIAMNPTQNNTNKIIRIQVQQSTITEYQKQREKSLKPPEEKRDYFQRRIRQKWIKLSESLLKTKRKPKKCRSLNDNAELADL